MKKGDDHIALDDHEGHRYHIRIEIEVDGKKRLLHSVPLTHMKLLRKGTTDESEPSIKFCGRPLVFSVDRGANRIEIWPTADQDYPHIVTTKDTGDVQRS